MNVIADVAPELLASKDKRFRALRTFGPADLERLARLAAHADESVPLREAHQAQFNRPERFLAVRHDMDHDLENALRFAEWEAQHGIRATYFVLHNDWYWGSDPATPSPTVLDTLDRIASFGHEIGLHNNAIATALRLDTDPALVLDRALGALRRHGFDIVGSATHGDPMCRSAGFVNNEVFTELARPAMGDPDRTIQWLGDDEVAHSVRLHPLPMREFGLAYEAYRIGSSMYTSDTGGRWHKPWDDVERHFIDEGAYLQILVHPVWWALSGEPIRVLETGDDQAPATTSHAPRATAVAADQAVRSNGSTAESSSMPTIAAPAPHAFAVGTQSRPMSVPDLAKPHEPNGAAPTHTMKLIVRGDCCSRRAINMNADLFGGRPLQVRDEKCRTDFFLDHVTVGSPTADDIAGYLAVEEMHKTLRHYTEEQITRAVLDPDDGDLIVMDSYSDMNFAAWQHRQKGWKLWIHPKFLRDRAAFERDFADVGRLTFEESVEAHVRLIERLRQRNGHRPVLFFNQPVSYYAKLRSERPEFDRLGAELERRVPDLYWAELDDSWLEPDDMNSCGPGQTLHFTGATYRRMIASALGKGLDRWLPEAARLIDSDRATAGLRPRMPATATPVVTAVASGDGEDAPPITSDPAPVTESPGGARRSTDELSISFQRADTPDRHCTALAEMLHVRFTAPHQRTPGIGAYQDGCSIAVLGETYDDWLATVSYTRRKLRRAEKLGYRFVEIDRRDYVDDVFAINTSMAERQGKPMTDSYRVRPTFGPMPEYSCPRHRLATYGVLEPDGKLVAYTWVYQVGDMCLFSTILGHGDHLDNGVMYLLIAGALERLIASANTKFAMYNMHRSGSAGLQFFKERMGFASYWVNWQLDAPDGPAEGR